MLSFSSHPCVSRLAYLVQTSQADTAISNTTSWSRLKDRQKAHRLDCYMSVVIFYCKQQYSKLHTHRSSRWILRGIGLSYIELCKIFKMRSMIIIRRTEDCSIEMFSVYGHTFRKISCLNPTYVQLDARQGTKPVSTYFFSYRSDTLAKFRNLSIRYQKSSI